MSGTAGYGILDNAFKQEYCNAVELELQQEGSVLRAHVSEQPLSGEAAAFRTRFGKSNSAQEIVGKYAPVEGGELEAMQRWMFPHAYQDVLWLDKFDEVKLITDPKAQYAQSQAYELGRLMDINIMKAFFGAALVKNAGNMETINWVDTAKNTVDVKHGASAATGLNVNKIKEGRKLLKNNYVPASEQIYMIITPDQERELFDQVQAVNGDYTANRPLDTGTLNRFFGVEFLVTPLANDVFINEKTGEYEAPMFTTKGIGIGVWKEIEVQITQRNDMNLAPWQIMAIQFYNAARVDEKRVVKIRCKVN